PCSLMRKISSGVSPKSAPVEFMYGDSIQSFLVFFSVPRKCNLRPLYHKRVIKVPGHSPGNSSRDSKCHRVRGQAVVLGRILGTHECSISRCMIREPGGICDERRTRRPPGYNYRREGLFTIKMNQRS